MCFLSSEVGVHMYICVCVGVVVVEVGGLGGSRGLEEGVVDSVFAGNFKFRPIVRF
jgi:hypothetical protein